MRPVAFFEKFCAMKISGLLKKVSAAVFLLPAAVPAVSAAPAEEVLPNVIVVIADDLG